MSFYNPINPGAGQAARADARREAIEDDVAGRRLVNEAAREEAIEEGLPLHRSILARLRATLTRRPE